MSSKFIEEIENKLKILANNSEINLSQVEEEIVSISQLISKEMFTRRKLSEEYKELEELQNLILRLEHPLLKDLEQKSIFRSIKEAFNVGQDMAYTCQYLYRNSAVPQIKRQEEAIHTIIFIDKYLDLKLEPIFDNNYQQRSEENKQKILQSIQLSYNNMIEILQDSFGKESFWQEIYNHLQNSQVSKLLEGNKGKTATPHVEKKEIDPFYQLKTPNDESMKLSTNSQSNITIEALNNEKSTIAESKKVSPESDINSSYNQSFSQAFASAKLKAESILETTPPESPNLDHSLVSNNIKTSVDNNKNKEEEKNPLSPSVEQQNSNVPTLQEKEPEKLMLKVIEPITKNDLALEEKLPEPSVVPQEFSFSTQAKLIIEPSPSISSTPETTTVIPTGSQQNNLSEALGKLKASLNNIKRS
jgi:hypothetical protein